MSTKVSAGMRKQLISVPALLSLVTILLAALGNLLANLVPDLVPSWIKVIAPPLFGIIVLAYLLVGFALGRLQEPASGVDPHLRSRRRRRITSFLLTVDGALAGIGGVLSNVLSSLVEQDLPPHLKQFAFPVFVLVLVMTIGLTVGLYLLQTAAPASQTDRTRFLHRLHLRYLRRQEDALRGATLIPLGLRSAPDGVSGLFRPSRLSVPGLSSHGDLPPGTMLAQVYQSAAGELLIMGEAGAGKTTLLVDLALKLLQRARTETTFPVPVIFNLSTWALDQVPLDKWLIEELKWTYRVPHRLAQSWMRRHLILPLLDGLDEMEEVAVRDKCVRTINQYQQEIRDQWAQQAEQARRRAQRRQRKHPAPPETDRRSHQSNQQVNGASYADQDDPQLPLVVCSRLTEYLAQSERLDLHAAVVVRPLTDGQMSAYLARDGEPTAALQAVLNANRELREVLRRPLFLRVAALAFEGIPDQMMPSLTNRRAWMQRLFQEYVARMLQRRRVLEASAADTPEEVEQTPYTPEQVDRYLSWLVAQMRAHQRVEFFPHSITPDWLPGERAYRRYRLRARLVYGPLVGILAGLGAGIVGDIAGGPTIGVAWALCFGVGVAAVGWLGVGLRGSLAKVIALGLSIGLITCVLWGITLGVVFGLFFALGASVVVDTQTQDEADPRTDLVTVPLLLGFFGALVGSVTFGLGREWGTGLVAGLVAGLVVGLVVGFTRTVADAIDDSTLYATLRWAQVLPSHHVRFLEYAAEHVLLDKVGSGYRFMHILLRDYFADRATALRRVRTA